MCEEITPLAFCELPANSMNLDKLFACTRSTFRDFYDELRRCFEEVDCFHIVEAEKCKALPWPKGQGVYAIWRKQDDRDTHSLVYVGMTGKFGHENGVALLPAKPNGFRKRAERYHPYCFTKKGPFSDNFEFDPLFSLNKIGKAPLEARYNRRLPISSLSIDCFVTEPAHKIAPAFVEALILQQYISSEGRLPEANNKF
jgi:hypothetical protein